MQVMITSIRNPNLNGSVRPRPRPMLVNLFVQTCKKMRPMPLSSCTLCSGSYWMME